MNGRATAGEDEGRLVTVFGGTGFLGSRIVRHVLDAGFHVRTATRHPEAAHPLFEPHAVEAVRADVLQDEDVVRAVAGAHAVVNAVSLYVEHGRATFDAIHVGAAGRIGMLAREAGVDHLVHISGIGSDPRSSDAYISARGRGEFAVEAAFGDEATFVRPAVMFGRDDAFLTTIVRLVDLLPVYPMFGDGRTRLQPAYVEDVGEAVAHLLRDPRRDGDGRFELAGPIIYTYRELVETVAAETGASTWPVPVPFGAWKLLATVAEHLPGSPLTRNQVALMEQDNLPSGDKPGLRQLDIEPKPIDRIVRTIKQDRDNSHGVRTEGGAT